MFWASDGGFRNASCRDGREVSVQTPSALHSIGRRPKGRLHGSSWPLKRLNSKFKRMNHHVSDQIVLRQVTDSTLWPYRQ